MSLLSRWRRLSRGQKLLGTAVLVLFVLGLALLLLLLVRRGHTAAIQKTLDDLGY